ncbi:MAG: MFS transporter [Burkholderiaceae bacterium]|nr:MFS transporter [Burkholderiaceae bacterium]
MPSTPSQQQPGVAFGILGAISVSHMINDMMQSLILAIYPLLSGKFALSFGQIGLITLVYQLTASIFQPLVGFYTDRKSTPYSLPVGMGFTLAGLVLLGFAPNYLSVLLAAALVGLGTSVFHPESSRVARMASGGRHGLAQSVFQVGGNTGGALGPLLTAAVITPFGLRSIAGFAVAALAGIVLLVFVSRWYAAHHVAAKARAAQHRTSAQTLPKKHIARVISVLLVLIFSKYFYIASISSYYTFYLIHRFGVSVQHSQLLLSVFLFATAAGTLIGGPLGDRIGRKPVIWASVLGVAPFALILPHANLPWTVALAVLIGLILSSAFPAILIYAQELLPGKIGVISGLFFGFAFGMGALGAAVLGELIDYTNIVFVYNVVAFLPLLGIVAALLPSNKIKPQSRSR